MNVLIGDRFEGFSDPHGGVNTEIGPMCLIHK